MNVFFADTLEIHDCTRHCLRKRSESSLNSLPFSPSHSQPPPYPIVAEKFPKCGGKRLPRLLAAAPSVLALSDLVDLSALSAGRFCDGMAIYSLAFLRLIAKVISVVAGSSISPARWTVDNKIDSFERKARRRSRGTFRTKEFEMSQERGPSQRKQLADRVSRCL